MVDTAKMSPEEIMRELQKPFDPSDIEWRVGSTTKDNSKGLALAYVTNRAIQNRLDNIFGPFGWRNEFQSWREKGQLCGISIKFGGEWITKWDGAENTNFEPVKGGLSDSMKRAAYQWGIGRYLYTLPATWVPVKQVGKSFTIAEKPNLPTSVLPMTKNDWATFWTAMKDMGFKQEDVHKQARETSIRHYTKEAATNLFKQMKALAESKKQKEAS